MDIDFTPIILLAFLGISFGTLTAIAVLLGLFGLVIPLWVVFITSVVMTLGFWIFTHLDIT